MVKKNISREEFGNLISKRMRDKKEPLQIAVKETFKEFNISGYNSEPIEIKDNKGQIRFSIWEMPNGMCDVMNAKGERWEGNRPLKFKCKD